MKICIAFNQDIICSLQETERIMPGYNYRTNNYPRRYTCPGLTGAALLYTVDAFL